MSAARESQSALRAVTAAAVADARTFMASTRGRFEARRAALLEVVPSVVSYYSQGSAALAADFYEDERARSGVTGRYTATLVIEDRTVSLRRGIAWASGPLEAEDVEAAGSRLAEVVQLHTASPYRETVAGNVVRDGKAYGWSRLASPNACRFCLMLADRGAVYSASTVEFAAHDNCHCTAQPLFGTLKPSDVVASPIQRRANAGRVRTAAQKAQLRDYLNALYPDARG